MNVQWLATSAMGGFLGMASAVAIAYVVIRRIIASAITHNELLKNAHEQNKCPICERPMRHDHGDPRP